MRNRKTLIVATSLVFGVFAGGIAYVYLHSVQNRAYENARLTNVFVVEDTIPQGMYGSTAITQGRIEKVEMPERFRPVDAVTNLASISADAAVSEIPSGQVVVAPLFQPQVATGGVAASVIPRGDVAITISVDAVHGVAGLIQPGDHVDLLVELANGNEEALMYQDVPVLATGSTLATSASPSGPLSSPTSQASSNGLITFVVPPAAAQRIALAESGGGGVLGSIYLALVPPGNTPVAVSKLTSDNLLPSAATAGASN